MQVNSLEAMIKSALRGAAVLLFGVGAVAAQQVSLTAGPSTLTLPDGSTVPMWGYTCGAAASSSGGATCTALNPAVQTSNAVAQATNSALPGFWSPVVISVPYNADGTTLNISFTNNLSFSSTGTTTNTIPTSLMIVGQLGGGLGTGASYVASPSHAQQGVTWSTANTGAMFTPPAQPARVQSFGTEVAAGATATLTWSNLRPGTYLIESGTHPSIQGPMGLYGMLVVTTAPSDTTPGTAYPYNATMYPNAPAVNYNSDVDLLFSEIDPVQNKAVSTAVNTVGFSETAVWNAQPGGCGDPSSPVYNTCYPPAVNYTPTYFVINGVGFSKTNPSNSVFPATAGSATTGIAGNVLVRMVNAGLKMHVPQIVGSLTTPLIPTLPTPAAPGTGASTAGATVTGLSLVAEDGNPLPGVEKVQSDVFMAAGKTYDVMINVPPSGSNAIPVYDRELSLSGNKINRDAGMLAYISVNGSAAPVAAGNGTAHAVNDAYSGLITGQTFAVNDPSKGVISNDTNVYGVRLLTPGANGTVTLNPNGTFTWVPTGMATADSFSYCANGTINAGVCSSGVTATVILTAASIETQTGNITLVPQTFDSRLATYIKTPNPGVLTGAVDKAGYSLTVSSISGASAGLTIVSWDPAGGFVATANGPGTYIFNVTARNSQGTPSNTVQDTVVFPAGSGIIVNVVDRKNPSTTISDYRWIIEEDRSFYIDPANTMNTRQTQTGPGTSIVPILGVNFHTSDMPYVAQGCTGLWSCETGQYMVDTRPACNAGSSTVPAGCSTTSGQHIPAVCDVGNGVCRPDPNAGTAQAGKTPVLPGQVALDKNKHYYISVLPGDAANPFVSGDPASGCPSGTFGNYPAGSSECGHGMGGAPITPICTGTGAATACSLPTSVTVLVEQDPFPPAKLSVNVFEDDMPLNGEQDARGGVDVLSHNEPGLGGFNIVLWDDMGGSGDVTGQMTYDMFNQPLSNSLDGTIDPMSGLNACPNTSTSGIAGIIVTCPKYETDGKTLSPLAGQAVLANLMPGRFTVQAVPGADRIARGENWLQTNTLDGKKAHHSFLRIGEPAYFQEFGPAGYHVSIGFANPAIINARLAGVCGGTDPNSPITNPTSRNPMAVPCDLTIKGKITTKRVSRTPDERLYSSGSHDSFNFTQCYISIGDPDGEDFAFTYCNADGTFSISGLPAGDWRVTTFDEWNDIIVNGLSTPIGLTASATIAAGGKQNCPGPQTTNLVCDMGDIASSQWQANVYTRTFIDKNKDGISQSSEGGIPFINTTVRYRDGSMANNLVTDETGTANFNETFPLFNWYVVEADTTRYKTTGIHTVYDASGPADGTLTTCATKARKGATIASGTGFPDCGNSAIGANLANTYEPTPLPANLSVPGAVYCSDADCSTRTGVVMGAAPAPSTTTNHSTGRIDPGWVTAEGWQGFAGQNNFIEFGKTPYVPGENGGIHGHVIYASTRPFDDPQVLVQTQWEPMVPHVTMNLYKEGLAADGVTRTLTLVDTTQTSSWDDWAQGFRSDGVPNMNCPGQTTSDLFYFSLYNQPNYLDLYSEEHPAAGGFNPAATGTALPYNSQYKCYDGMHNWNQLQPAVYDGMYSFPSVTGIHPATGKPAGTNCTACTTDPDSSDPYRYGLPMLPPGKYVVEVVPPPGYEIVKEEDKNILIGDNFIAPVTQEFGGLGDVFIIPDQASVAASQQDPGPGYNQYSNANLTQNLGAAPQSGIVPGSTPELVWPCVGDLRVIPDYISLFPLSRQVAPFAGATRPLCDRKELTLNDQAGAIAEFYIYTSTHKAAKFTGVITDDFTSEFDPFSPQFGEKFAPPNQPIAIKDWTGAEIGRVYADWWGDYDGMTYSTWEVNPPNAAGYSPTMMTFCMNDKGPILDTRAGSATNGQMRTDPLYNPAYSQFCYELPYMPGQTQYLDTPVVPTSAFSAGYSHPDCSYPDATPSISSVTGDVAGPWVSASGHTITINSLPDQQVQNYGYVGPSATAAPFNTKTVNRHFGFGATQGAVAIGGVVATVRAWSDTQITATVPSGIPNCAAQQQAIYGGSRAQCGELLIINANGQQSIDTVTITVGGKSPSFVNPALGPMTVNGPGAIQQAIDAANPGDLIIVPPGTYKEMVIMWKPVRLQGVGAASSIIDANAQPAGLNDVWRRQVACDFGIAINGRPISSTNLFDPSKTYTCPTAQQFSVDRLPLEATVGWDATLNGNLAELRQEPTLMSAYEGAGITVLGKGVKFPAGSAPFGSDTFQTGTRMLSAKDCLDSTGTANPYPGNFMCNPSSIDGLSITDSSQGGGINVHGWNHNIQIANNRIFGNTGTFTGGIAIGRGEFPPQYVAGGTTNADPLSCADPTYGQGAHNPFFGGSNPPTPSLTINEQQPYCFNLFTNVHNNAVTNNSSIGDQLFSGALAGAGGVTFCTGADYYKFNYNWICGNMSSGDGGGVAHMGFSFNADIRHNSIIFNQSLNPAIPTNGGGLMIMGTPDTDPVCGAQADADCPAGFSDGVGPKMVINGNLIQGNSAEAGTGGGLRFQSVNGTEVTNFPHESAKWYSPLVTNNIIVNNVAGWDGGGVSFEDALNVRFINNTVASNDSTATAGMLFNTLGAPLASSQTSSKPTYNASTSLPQVAGLVSMQNSLPLTTALAGVTLNCPNPWHLSPAPSSCNTYSDPLLANNIFWQNRTFFVGVGSYNPGVQQNLVALYNSPTIPGGAGTMPANQAVTGECVSGSSYWDIGVRGDTGPGSHSTVALTAGTMTLQLSPRYSLMTNAAEYSGVSNSHDATAASAGFTTQYCNGSRVPPEFAAGTFNVPPGIADATVPNPPFTLAPAATADEGNGVDMTWGPLSMTNPVAAGTDGNYGGGAALGNYALSASSPAIDQISATSAGGEFAPTEDFFGNPRPNEADSLIDYGAVEFAGAVAPPSFSSINLTFGYRGTTFPVTISGSNLAGTTSVAISGTGVTVAITGSTTSTISATFTIAEGAALTVRNLSITTPGGATTAANAFTVLPASISTVRPTWGLKGPKPRSFTAN